MNIVFERRTIITESFEFRIVHYYNKREREKKKQKREIEDKRLNSWFACAENLMQMSAVI